MMKWKNGLVWVVLAMLVVPSEWSYAASSDSANVQAQYRDVSAMVYDKTRGVYGKDYVYDYASDKFTTLSAPTTIPAKTIRLDGRLDEDIWKDIKPVTVKLEPTHPWGGAVKEVQVRAANNGTWLFLAFEWRDSTNSKEESARVKRPEGGFFYNSTHFYSDNLFIGWWMKEGQPPVIPWFNSHYAGTTMGRVPWKNDPSAKANLWLFKAYFSDDDQPYWPLTATTPRTWRWGPNTGKPLVFPYPHLVETLLNSTANYFIGTGVTHVSGCAFPEKDTYPWDVRGNGQWNEGKWALEVARPFTPHPLNEPLDATMKFKADRLYWFFLGAGDGHLGENEDVGSVSQWLSLFISPASPDTGYLLLAISGALVVSVGVGGLVLWRRHRVESVKNG